MPSDVDFSIYGSPLMMVINHSFAGNLAATSSHRDGPPAQRSTTMVDEVVRVCPAHPCALRISRMGRDAAQRQSTALVVEMTTGSRRAAKCTRWSPDDTE